MKWESRSAFWHTRKIASAVENLRTVLLSGIAPCPCLWNSQDSREACSSYRWVVNWCSSLGVLSPKVMSLSPFCILWVVDDHGRLSVLSWCFDTVQIKLFVAARLSKKEIKKVVLLHDSGRERIMANCALWKIEIHMSLETANSFSCVFTQVKRIFSRLNSVLGALFCTRVSILFI